MIQKDLNLFDVYKSGAGKGDGSNKSLIILIVSFVLVILFAYGGIMFLKMTMQGQINAIKKELEAPAVIEANTKIANELKMNELLVKYNTAITLAKKSFDTSKILDSALFAKITSSMPADVVASQISINPQTLSISCNCTDKLSPAVFTQSLRAKNIFKSIVYDGLSAGENGAGYTFTLNCTFEEVASK